MSYCSYNVSSSEVTWRVPAGVSPASSLHYIYTNAPTTWNIDAYRWPAETPRVSRVKAAVSLNPSTSSQINALCSYEIQKGRGVESLPSSPVQPLLYLRASFALLRHQFELMTTSLVGGDMPSHRLVGGAC